MAKTKKENALKKEKLLRLIKENYLKLGITKTKTQLLLEAGYSPSVANQQSVVFDYIKEDIDPLIKKLEKERNAVLERMKKTRIQAKYRDLVMALDVVTKNHQLLSGKPTENLAQTNIVALINITRNLLDGKPISKPKNTGASEEQI
jgi:hypothetical protein